MIFVFWIKIMVLMVFGIGLPVVGEMVARDYIPWHEERQYWFGLVVGVIVAMAVAMLIFL